MPEILQRLEEVSAVLDDMPVIDPRLFAQILDSLPDGLIVINDQGIIRHVNQQIELMFGYPRSMLIGEPVHMLLPENLRGRHALHIARYFEHPTARSMAQAQTLSGRHRSGRAIKVQISLGPVMSEQGVLALALVRRVHDDASG